MTFQFPFRCKYTITQRYDDNFNNYPGGRHGAWDIVPLDQNGMAFPGEIYPIGNGTEVYVLDTDPVKGEGIKERIDITNDQPLLDYLLSLGLYKPITHGSAYLDVTYWHILKALDKDGSVDVGQPIALAGNTGDVWSQGQKVPDNQKGVPPYPGLHLHLQIQVYTDNYGVLNMDKDIAGRIDPALIFNYQPQQGENMIIFQEQGSPALYTFAGDTMIPFTDMDTFDKFLNGRQYVIVQIAPQEFVKFNVSSPYIKQS